MSTRCSGAIIIILFMLAKCERVRSAEFRSLLFDAAHATLAGRLMLFVTHFNIILRRATKLVICEE